MRSTTRRSGTRSAEARLLMLAAGPEGNDPAIAALLEGPVDWATVARLAVREQAVPPLVRRLRRVARGMPAGAEPLARIALPVEFKLHRDQARLHDALRALAGAGVVPLLLKGVALAHDVYGGMGDRPMGDADLLVRPEDGPRALRALEEAGWRRGEDVADDRPYAEHHHLPPLDDVRGGGPTVELHTALFAAGHPFPGDPDALNPEGMRSRARRRTVGGADVLIPDRIDLLLHAAVHFAWSHVMRSAAWRTARDVGVLLASGSVEPEALVARARASRATTSLYWTLRLARVLAGVEAAAIERRVRPPVPEALLSRLEEHYVRALFRTAEEVCPSVLLERTLWSMGMRPTASGHGARRPWDHDERFLPEAAEGAPPGGGGQRRPVRERLARAARATLYGARLVLGA